MNYNLQILIHRVRAASPSALPRTWAPWELILIPLLVALATVRHLAHYLEGAGAHHLPEIIERQVLVLWHGRLWVPGPPLSHLGVQLGGPLFYWLHLPSMAFANPILGNHVLYLAYELLALTLWLRWGRRLGLDREVLWTSALLLDCFAGAATGIGENTILASILLIMFFMLFLTMLSRGSVASMALAGGVFGLCVQVHQTGLFLVPALALTLKARGHRPWLHALSFGLGFVLAAVLALPSVVLPDLGGVAASGSRLVGRFSWEGLVGVLAYPLQDPLSLLGLGVLGARALRGRLADHERLALLWMLLCWAALGSAIALLGESFRPHLRFLMLNPARAMLGAIAALWLVRASLATARHILPQIPSPGWLLPIVAVLAVAGFGLRAHRASGSDFFAARPRPLPVAACAVWDRLETTRGQQRLLDNLRQSNLHSLYKNHILEYMGDLESHLSALSLFLDPDRSSFPRDLPRRAHGHVWTLFAPRFPTLDLGALPGARSTDDYIVIPGTVAADVRPGASEDEYRLEIPASERSPRLLLLTLLRRGESLPLLGVVMQTPSGPLLPQAEIACAASGQHHALFRLGVGPRTRVRVHMVGPVRRLGETRCWATLLPSAAGPP